MAEERRQTAQEPAGVVALSEEPGQVQAAVEESAIQLSEPAEAVAASVTEQGEQVLSEPAGEQVGQLLSEGVGAPEGAGLLALQPTQTLQPYWLNGEPSPEQLKAYWKTLRQLQLP